MIISGKYYNFSLLTFDVPDIDAECFWTSQVGELKEELNIRTSDDPSININILVIRCPQIGHWMSSINMEVAKTKLDGVLLITHDGFEDFRGNFNEVYNKELYEKNGISVNFIQDNTGVTHQFVLRGIHGGSETWKLITCIEGRIYFVAVNCDTDSPDFGKWESFLLTGENRRQLLVPAKFGSSYVVLSPKAIVHYKQSTYYDQDKKFSYKWNDPRFSIWWPIKNPILSEKDE